LKLYEADEIFDLILSPRETVDKSKNTGFWRSASGYHEVAMAGQCEIIMYRDTLANMADGVMTYKFVVKNVAKSMNLVATFMSKPVFGDNASGMHVNVSL
jgi:glutamine synthetase